MLRLRRPGVNLRVLRQHLFPLVPVEAIEKMEVQVYVYCAG